MKETGAEGADKKLSHNKISVSLALVQEKVILAISVISPDEFPLSCSLAVSGSDNFYYSLLYNLLLPAIAMKRSERCNRLDPYTRVFFIFLVLFFFFLQIWVFNP